ncbi:MAG TPA: alpha/beta fold hydrolase [Candidatus Anoxymicrobiaceae bacterium]|jgi:pimeloyl-ACP methyl ester carboxylesterase
MGKIMGTLSTAAALGLYGYGIKMGLGTPLPGQEQDVAAGLDVELHEFETADGLKLRLKRYANPEGTPVLMCHGFGSTGFVFDLPREGRNMAVYLAREGFDVWVSSFRGCGREPYLSECAEWNHSIDHLAVFDAPALVDGVSEVTGKQLFYVGHSMGGEVLYMLMQGVAFEGGRVVSDPALVRRRQEQIAGGITLGSPPAMSRPEGSALNRLLRSGAGTAALEAIVENLRKQESRPHKSIAETVRKLARHPRLMMAASRLPLAATAYYRPNTDKDATTSLVKWATGDVSNAMNTQLFEAISSEHFLEHLPEGATHAAYDYTAGMGLITTPLFFFAAEKDFFHSSSIKEYGFDAVSSSEKKFLFMAGYGHTDMVMGKRVESEVYPLIADWMNSVSGR